MWQLIVAVAITRPVVGLAAQPLQVVAATLVAVMRDHADVIEPVVWLWKFEHFPSFIVAGMFMRIVCPIGLFRLGEMFVRHPLFVCAHCRNMSKGLQMALADGGGAIPCVTQDIDKGICVSRKRQPIMPQTIHRRIAPGKDRPSVRHADRGGYVELGKPGSTLGELVDVWRLDHRVAGAPEPIGSVLVSDDVEDIWAVTHAVASFRFRTV